MDDSECLVEFQVQSCNLPALDVALQLSDEFVCPQHSVTDGKEGYCRLLQQLAIMCLYFYMILCFGKLVTVLSMITNTMLDYIYNSHGYYRGAEPFFSQPASG